jgi:hypothetical protein
MNTAAMICAISSVCFCYLPGIWGIFAILLAVASVFLAIWGITQNVKKPENFAMAWSTWIIAISSFVYGVALPRRNSGTLGFDFFPAAIYMNAVLCILLFLIFLQMQRLAQGKLRITISLISVLLFLLCGLFAVEALLRFHALGGLLVKTNI